jgi:SAM-dependent methyltransferase
VPPDWVKDFYTKQIAWGIRYSTDDELSDACAGFAVYVGAVRRLAGSGPHRLLELGPGGGGVSAALAASGHTVVAIEIVDEAAERASWWSRKLPAGQMTVIHGDFYDVEPGAPFDAVCYFDGFGIGTDDEQRVLLRRVRSWLAPNGVFLVDVLTPWYWSAQTGRPYAFGGLEGRFGFNAEGCRMIAEAWPSGDRSNIVAQTLRCYSPADLVLLLEGTGLVLESYEPYDNENYDNAVPLHQAMLYLAKIVPEPRER